MSVVCNPRPRGAESHPLLPEREAITSFLASIGEDIHVCSIALDGGRCTGRWFGEDIQAAADWALFESHAGHNVYWTTNRVAENCNRKPSKVDVVSARFAHIDIDPPKGGGALDKLQTQAELLSLSVPPTLIIDSGGGLQAFWKLAGSASIVEVEVLNKSLAERLGGDHCHNVDRLMRLPGTVNYPNAKKRAAGRTPSLAKVIYNA